ncbi:hypothetical protein C1M53_31580 [Mesorhizobium sp. Pch-S]|nr:hypothetical protein C1M53_31580 [Mesorhizobium sp. Pch-S]
MISLRDIRHLLETWASWRNKQRLYRAYPELEEIDRKRAEHRKSHKRGVAVLDRRARVIMTEALREGRH